MMIVLLLFSIVLNFFYNFYDDYQMRYVPVNTNNVIANQVDLGQPSKALEISGNRCNLILSQVQAQQLVATGKVPVISMKHRYK